MFLLLRTPSGLFEDFSKNIFANLLKSSFGIFCRKVFWNSSRIFYEFFWEFFQGCSLWIFFCEFFQYIVHLQILFQEFLWEFLQELLGALLGKSFENSFRSFYEKFFKNFFCSFLGKSFKSLQTLLGFSIISPGISSYKSSSRNSFNSIFQNSSRNVRWMHFSDRFFENIPTISWGISTVSFHRFFFQYFFENSWQSTF